MEEQPEQTSFLPDERKPGEYVIPAGIESTQCRSCGAEIVFTRTERGNAIPLDLATARSCNGERVALNHFVTCPEGRTWRKRR